MGYRSQVGYAVQGPLSEMVPVLTAFRMTYREDSLETALGELK